MKVLLVCLVLLSVYYANANPIKSKSKSKQKSFPLPKNLRHTPVAQMKSVYRKFQAAMDEANGRMNRAYLIKALKTLLVLSTEIRQILRSKDATRLAAALGVQNGATAMRVEEVDNLIINAKQKIVDRIRGSIASVLDLVASKGMVTNANVITVNVALLDALFFYGIGYDKVVSAFKAEFSKPDQAQENAANEEEETEIAGGDQAQGDEAEEMEGTGEEEQQEPPSDGVAAEQSEVPASGVVPDVEAEALEEATQSEPVPVKTEEVPHETVDEPLSKAQVEDQSENVQDVSAPLAEQVQSESEVASALIKGDSNSPVTEQSPETPMEQQESTVQIPAEEPEHPVDQTPAEEPAAQTPAEQEEPAEEPEHLIDQTLAEEPAARTPAEQDEPSAQAPAEEAAVQTTVEQEEPAEEPEHPIDQTPAEEPAAQTPAEQDEPVVEAPEEEPEYPAVQTPVNPDVNAAMDTGVDTPLESPVETQRVQSDVVQPELSEVPISKTAHQAVSQAYQTAKAAYATRAALARHVSPMNGIPEEAPETNADPAHDEERVKTEQNEDQVAPEQGQDHIPTQASKEEQNKAGPMIPGEETVATQAQPETEPVQTKDEPVTVPAQTTEHSGAGPLVAEQVTEGGQPETIPVNDEVAGPNQETEIEEEATHFETEELKPSETSDQNSKTVSAQTTEETEGATTEHTAEENPSESSPNHIQNDAVAPEPDHDSSGQHEAMEGKAPTVANNKAALKALASAKEAAERLAMIAEEVLEQNGAVAAPEAPAA